MVNEAGRALMIPHNIEGTITQAVIRSLKEKRFLTLNTGINTPFGTGTLPPNRSFRDPIVIVEGVADMYALRRIEPSTVCTLTSALSSTQLQVVTKMTQTVILAYDNDDTGRRSTNRDTRRLTERGVNVLTLRHPPSRKDPGEMLELALQGDLTLPLIESQYRQQLRIIKDNNL